MARRKAPEKKSAPIQYQVEIELYRLLLKPRCTMDGSDYECST